jgi:hypothetical protein
LGQILGVGKKADTGGFQLWKGCLENDPKSWEKMRKYNKQDVVLLEKIYLKLRPYFNNHPNVAIDSLQDDSPSCPCCGSKKLVRRGYAYTNSSKFARLCCSVCGKWSKSKLNEIPKSQRESIVNNIV